MTTQPVHAPVGSRRRRKLRQQPEGLGTATCAAGWFRMDPVLAEEGWDRHPGCSGWPDGSRVQEYATFES